MRSLVVLGIFAGCYSPAPAPGAPCAAGDVCPSGLVCRADLCVLPGSPPPDGPIAVGDGPASDGPHADAPLAEIGCSDGEREGFPDLAAFPTIAGCTATWEGAKDMRAPKTGEVCGDDANQKCGEPADACAEGWSVCGEAGLPAQITARADAGDCLSAGGANAGAFAGAMSHCSALPADCEYDTPFPCLDTGDCSEAVCCGPACSAEIFCADGLYPQSTRVAGDNVVGCGALLPDFATGVLCCRD